MENLTGAKEALNPAAFHKWERHLAGALGLTLDEIRELRVKNLRVKEHYITHKNKLMYSPAGVLAMTALVKVAASAPKAEAAPGDSAGEVEGSKKIVAQKAAPPEVQTLVIFRAGLKHGQIIEAHFPDKDPAVVANRLRVRVRSDKHFIKGMQIPVTLLQQGLYLLARPCPRSKGKW